MSVYVILFISLASALYIAETFHNITRWIGAVSVAVILINLLVRFF